jgi:hypothetical protein
MFYFNGYKLENPKKFDYFRQRLLYLNDLPPNILIFNIIELL